MAKVTTWVIDKLSIVGEIKLEALNTATPNLIDVIRRLVNFGLEFGYVFKLCRFENKALMEACLKLVESNLPLAIPENCPKTRVEAKSEVNRVFTWILHRLEE